MAYASFIIVGCWALSALARPQTADAPTRTQRIHVQATAQHARLSYTIHRYTTSRARRANTPLAGAGSPFALTYDTADSDTHTVQCRTLGQRHTYGSVQEHVDASLATLCAHY